MITLQIRVSVDDDDMFESEKPEKMRMQNNGTKHRPPMEVNYILKPMFQPWSNRCQMLCPHFVNDYHNIQLKSGSFKYLQ